MQERRLIKQLKQHDPDALSELMQQYTAYVGTIVRNILGKVLTESDVEEVTADVFVIVWNHSKEIQQGNCAPILRLSLETAPRIGCADIRKQLV